MDKRRYTRVPFRVTATVEARMRLFAGDVENLSVNGLFLRTQERLTVGEHVRIIIRLAGADPDLSVAVQADAVRQDEDGLAFRFDGVDLDSFGHLRRIIEFNTADPDRVVSEVVGRPAEPAD